MVRLDIFSDPICPWCYIGKTHLDQAIKQTGTSFFDIRWHPLQLNPDMPPEGMDRRSYLEQKFGGQAGAIKAYTSIFQHAEAVGLNINFEAIKKTPNTLNAHRMIHWSEAEGRQDEIVSALFEAYFLEGCDLNEPEQLCKIAHTAGMEKALVERLLITENDLFHIAERDKNARKMGISAVPTFIIAGKHVVHGVQIKDFWSTVITEISDNLSIADSA